MRLDAIADALFERIERQAATIEGEIAQLQALDLDPPDVWIAGLRDIAAEGRCRHERVSRPVREAPLGRVLGASARRISYLGEQKAAAI